MTFPPLAGFAQIRRGTNHNGTAIVDSVDTTNYLVPGMYVLGAGVPKDTRITWIDSATQFRLNNNCVAGAGTQDFGVIPDGIMDLRSERVWRGFHTVTGGLVVPNSRDGSQPTAGTMYFAPAWLMPGDVVRNVYMWTTTAATGAQPTLLKLGVCDRAGMMLCQSADEKANAAWTALGPAEIAMTSTYTATEMKLVYLCFLQVGTWGGTALQIGRWSSVTQHNNVFPTGNTLRAVQWAGQTDMPANGSSATVTSVGTIEISAGTT